jgi:tRNA threonylcarbamoyladenosine biosynthesis protein TsaE
VTSHDAFLANGGERLMTLDELTHFGEQLGRALIARLPVVVTLNGDLGTGKTTLTRAIARGFGVDEPVTSPTFALVHEYHVADGRQLFHLDLYRIKGPQELANLGWESISGERALVIIEWPERAGHLVPSDALEIRLSHVAGDDTRRVLAW